MSMSVACAATAGHVSVHGSCYHQSPCLWPVLLLLGPMLMSMVHISTEETLMDYAAT